MVGSMPRQIVRIRYQRFGTPEDPTFEWPVDCFDCLSYDRLEDGSFRFRLPKGGVRTIPAGDMDLDELRPNGTLSSLLPKS